MSALCDTYFDVMVASQRVGGAQVTVPFQGAMIRTTELTAPKRRALPKPFLSMIPAGLIRGETFAEIEELQKRLVVNMQRQIQAVCHAPESTERRLVNRRSGAHA